MGKNFWLIVALFFLILAIAGVVYWSNFGISISKYDVSSEQLPSGFEGYRIVQLSDLHSASVGQGNSSLLHAVEESAPDIVVMTGDMVSRYDTDFSVTLALCAKIAEKYPTYYIQGNHEEGLAKEDWYTLKEALEECGVTVLDNEVLTLSAANGHTVNLIGLWFNLDYYHQMTSYYQPFTGETIQKILGSAPEGYNILLAHNPNYFEVYAAWGADLTLSGHIHGGMVRLPFIGGVLSPETLLFPKYDAGLYQQDASAMVLSRGLGRGRMGIRLFNPPDVVLITLHNSGQ